MLMLCGEIIEIVTKGAMTIVYNLYIDLYKYINYLYMNNLTYFEDHTNLREVRVQFE